MAMTGPEFSAPSFDVNRPYYSTSPTEPTPHDIRHKGGRASPSRSPSLTGCTSNREPGQVFKGFAENVGIIVGSHLFQCGRLARRRARGYDAPT